MKRPSGEHLIAARRAMSERVYRLTGLSVRYPGSGPLAPYVVKDLSLTVNRGEQLVLIGPSGAGKTTLLSVLALAREPAQGTVELFSQNVWALSSSARHQLRKRLFLAPQAPPLPPRQRVVTAVLAGLLPRWAFGTALLSLIRPHDARVAFEALERFDLGDKLWVRVDRLSGGERQRVSMARMLVADTEVMLVDEPLSALDPRLAAQTLQSIQVEAARRGATLVASLHQVELAHVQFPRVVGLRDGCVQFDLPRERVTAEILRDLYAGAEEEVLAAGAPSVDGMVRRWRCL
jgi:phosphonate transport system ATP-binding protein